MGNFLKTFLIKKLFRRTTKTQQNHLITSDGDHNYRMKNNCYLLVSPKPKTLPQSQVSNGIETSAMFPVGLAYVSSSMKNAGFDVKTCNLNFIQTDIKSHLTKLISECNIDILCTGGQSLDVHGITEIINIAKSIRHDIKIVVGGAIITADPLTAMRVLNADIGVIGEGEETMRELANAFRDDLPINNISGITYWDDGVPTRSPSRAENNNLEYLPLMDFDGFSYQDWLNKNGNTGIIFASRSCPFKCTFCFKSTGEKYRSRSLASVFQEIDYQIMKYNISSISISDELFAVKKSRIIDFCKEMQQRNLQWGCSLRIPEIDEDLLRTMKISGCNSVGVGLESGSEAILNSMQKKVKLYQLKDALSIFCASDLTMIGNFIFGDINETVETYTETLCLWEKYNKHVCINLGTLCVLPGTYVYEYACKKGIIQDRERFLKDGKFAINVTNMSDSEHSRMLSTITDLSFLPQIPATSLTILSSDNQGNCSVEWICRRCNALQLTHGIHFLQAPIVTCSCGVKNTIEPFKDITCVAERFFLVLPIKEKIAFWGVGSQYYRLARHYAHFESENFIQIDADEKHQNMTRLNKQIYAPSYIVENDVIHIVITSPIAKDKIIEAIRHISEKSRYIYYPQLANENGKFIPYLQAL